MSTEGVSMTLPGFTMMDIQDPKKKLEKLNERLQYIDSQIAELEEKKWLILCEMSLIHEELGVVK
jgi:hypothetical protein